jgi:tetratricopeptide (TPR) repeat protein
LDQALAINPHDSAALSMRAACWYLTDNTKEFRATVRHALKVNPRDAAFYHRIAEYSVRQHRYQAAIDFENRAISLDPEYWPAHVGLGVGYSRIGNDKKANEALQRAFENDPYNVQAFNMTEHFYDGPAKTMEWLDIAPFRVRVHRNEAAVLQHALPPVMKAAYQRHKKAYGFTPKKPLHVEFFPDRSTFSVRTTGYPRLGAHGVCFGHVVTILSPSNGAYNWAMVLWHELAHVWHIQMSKSRVPRWFTEGLAEHETTLRRPEWRRELDAELWRAEQKKKLTGVDRFNTMFTQAQSMDDMMVAYYYASKVVAFIDAKWGFEVFPKMLSAWGSKKNTPQVFQSVLKLSLSEFDALLKKHLKSTLFKRFSAAYEGEGGGELDAIYKRAAASVKAEKWAEAGADLDALFQAGKDGALLRMMRARIYLKQKDWKGAREQLEKAIALNPQYAAAYALMHKVLKEQGDKEALYRLLKRSAENAEHDAKLQLKLVGMARERKAWPDMLRFAERVVHIRPFSAASYSALADAQIRNGSHAKGLKNARFGLQIPGTDERVALKILEARALAAAGQENEAKSILEGLGDNKDAKQALDEIF